MPDSEHLLKFLCILKKRKGGGFDHYYNKSGNYWRPEEYLSADGFTSWRHFYEAGPDTERGFVACQMRPRSTFLPIGYGSTLRYEMDYHAPFEEWKFAFRHQPSNCPVPDWVCVGEVRSECIRLLSQWSENHIVRGGQIESGERMAIVALGRSRVTQSGGDVWTYDSCAVMQQSGCGGSTYLHDSSTGFIRGTAMSYDRSWMELSGSGRGFAYGSSTVVLWPRPDGSFGEFMAFGPGVRAYRVKPGVSRIPWRRVADRDLIQLRFEAHPEPAPVRTRGINMPFGCAVD